MKRFQNEEIIERALSRIRDTDEADINKDLIDIAVDLKDEHALTHSYVVSFKKGSQPGEKEWIPVDISEVSTW